MLISLQVHLNVACDKDTDLRQLIDFIRKETFPDSNGWYRLGLVLWKMGEPAKAQQVYEILLGQETKESDKASIYHQVGLIKDEQGEYAKGIAYYEKALEIEERQIPHRDQSLTTSYDKIGLLHEKIGNYSKAHACFERAVGIG